MEAVLEPIRAALATDATPEARTAGIAACRAVLAALEAQTSTPMVAAEVADPSSNPIAQIVGTLRGVSPEQLLDLAIARLRAALPAGAESPPVAPIKFHIIPVPRRG